MKIVKKYLFGPEDEGREENEENEEEEEERVVRGAHSCPHRTYAITHARARSYPYVSIALTPILPPPPTDDSLRVRVRSRVLQLLRRVAVHRRRGRHIVSSEKDDKDFES